jgi:two-component system, NarL family, response regulator NreC
MTLLGSACDPDGAGGSRTPEDRTRGVNRLRVFLIDDHAVVRVGLRTLIDAQPDMETLGEAADGRGAARDVTTARPDVVILDLSARGEGVAAVAALLQAYPTARVLALSAHEHPAHVRQMLAAGAVGYVLKRSAPDDVIRAVRAVANGGTYLDPALGHAAAGPHFGGADGPACALSEREGEVVRLIARGYSNKEIAAKLALSVKTVETYKARSLEKLGVRTRVGLVRYAAECGWLSGWSAAGEGVERHPTEVGADSRPTG